jgi:hypothetical protein
MKYSMNPEILHCLPYVLCIFGGGRNRAGNRDGGRSSSFYCFPWNCPVRKVEEDEVQGRDVMDALKAGAPATHDTRLRGPSWGELCLFCFSVMFHDFPLIHSKSTAFVFSVVHAAIILLQ